MTLHYDIQHNDSQQKRLIFNTLHDILYAECRNLCIIMLNIIMLSVVMLNVVTLNVVMLNVVMLHVVAPRLDAE